MLFLDDPKKFCVDRKFDLWADLEKILDTLQALLISRKYERCRLLSSEFQRLKNVLHYRLEDLSCCEEACLAQFPEHQDYLRSIASKNSARSQAEQVRNNGRSSAHIEASSSFAEAPEDRKPAGYSQSTLNAAQTSSAHTPTHRTKSPSSGSGSHQQRAGKGSTVEEAYAKLCSNSRFQSHAGVAQLPVLPVFKTAARGSEDRIETTGDAMIPGSATPSGAEIASHGQVDPLIGGIDSESIERDASIDKEIIVPKVTEWLTRNDFEKEPDELLLSLCSESVVNVPLTNCQAVPDKTARISSSDFGGYLGGSRDKRGESGRSPKDIAWRELVSKSSEVDKSGFPDPEEEEQPGYSEAKSRNSETKPVLTENLREKNETKPVLPENLREKNETKPVLTENLREKKQINTPTGTGLRGGTSKEDEKPATNREFAGADNCATAFPPAECPFNDKEMILSEVSLVFSPLEIGLIPFELIEPLRAIEQRLEELEEQLRAGDCIPREMLEDGMPCAVRGEYGILRRGLILKVATDSCFVRFVDVGSEKLVENRDLYFLPDLLTRIQPTAFVCCIARVDSREISAEAKSRFTAQVRVSQRVLVLGKGKKGYKKRTQIELFDVNKQNLAIEFQTLKSTSSSASASGHSESIDAGFSAAVAEWLGGGACGGRPEPAESVVASTFGGLSFGMGNHGADMDAFSESSTGRSETAVSNHL